MRWSGLLAQFMKYIHDQRKKVLFVTGDCHDIINNREQQ